MCLLSHLLGNQLKDSFSILAQKEYAGAYHLVESKAGFKSSTDLVLTTESWVMHE